MTSHIFLDVVLIFGATLFWFTVVSAIQTWRSRAKKATKGNPFRQFKDWQVNNMLEKR